MSHEFSFELTEHRFSNPPIIGSTPKDLQKFSFSFLRHFFFFFLTIKLLDNWLSLSSRFNFSFSFPPLSLWQQWISHRRDFILFTSDKSNERLPPSSSSLVSLLKYDTVDENWNVQNRSIDENGLQHQSQSFPTDSSLHPIDDLFVRFDLWHGSVIDQFLRSK